jgi:hypothetical protein
MKLSLFFFLLVVCDFLNVEAAPKQYGINIDVGDGIVMKKFAIEGEIKKEGDNESTTTKPPTTTTQTPSSTILTPSEKLKERGADDDEAQNIAADEAQNV